MLRGLSTFVINALHFSIIKSAANKIHTSFSEKKRKDAGEHPCREVPWQRAACKTSDKWPRAAGEAPVIFTHTTLTISGISDAKPCCSSVQLAKPRGLDHETLQEHAIVVLLSSLKFVSLTS